MVTLLPALLVIFGRWMFWPKRPALRQRGADRDRPLGQGRRAGSPRSRARSGWSPPASCCVACLGLLTLDTAGLSTEDSYTKEFDSIKGQKVLVEHGLVDNSNTVQVVANTDEIDAVVASIDDVDGLGEPTEAQPISDTPLLLRGRRSTRTSRPRRRSTSSRTPATPCTPSTGPTPGRRRVGVLPRHQDRLEPRQQGDHPDRPGRGAADPDRAAAGPGVAADPDRRR